MQTTATLLPSLVTLDNSNDITKLTNNLCDNHFTVMNMLPKNVSYPFSAKVVYDFKTVGAYILPD